MKYLTPALFLMSSTSAAFCGEVVLGVGADDVLKHTETSATAIVAEYHSAPFLRDAMPITRLLPQPKSTTMAMSS